MTVQTTPQSIDLNQTGIEPEDPNYRELFGDLQGNILKSHGRDHSVHLFLRFTASPEKCRAWLKKEAARLTSAAEQQQQAMQHKEDGAGSLFATLMLSSAGYRALGVPETEWPADKAFRAGMRDLEQLYDTTPTGDHKPSKNPLNDNLEDWDEEFKGQIDLLLILAYAGAEVKNSEAQAKLTEEVKRLQEELDGVAELCNAQYGHVLRNDKGQVIEHFGFVDGVSNPLFLRRDLEQAYKDGGFSNYDPSAPLSSVLVKDPGGGSSGYGTYVVYRKLQQNIRGFWDFLETLAKKISEEEEQEVSAEYVGALAVGRFKDGTPICEQVRDGWSNLTNNFNYDGDAEGLRCPFFAHTRKTNPRNDTAREKQFTPTQERARRIVRRGISYGSTNLDPETEWTDAGLLFLSLQSNIEQQFIFMQANWCNNKTFLRFETGLDPLIGQKEEGSWPAPQKWKGFWGQSGKTQRVEMGGFIKTRGGEYFFVPSLSFLKGL